MNIRSLILQNFEQAAITEDLATRKALLNFVIVGGGSTGVELAGAIAELKDHILPKDYQDLTPSDMQIYLLEGSSRVLPTMSAESSKKAARFLNKLGVLVHCNTFVKAQLLICHRRHRYCRESPGRCDAATLDHDWRCTTHQTL